MAAPFCVLQVLDALGAGGPNSVANLERRWATLGRRTNLRRREGGLNGDVRHFAHGVRFK